LVAGELVDFDAAVSLLSAAVLDRGYAVLSLVAQACLLRSSNERVTVSTRQVCCWTKLDTCLCSVYMRTIAASSWYLPVSVWLALQQYRDVRTDSYCHAASVLSGRLHSFAQHCALPSLLLSSRLCLVYPGVDCGRYSALFSAEPASGALCGTSMLRTAAGVHSQESSCL
jgi:hypothetical protein